MTSTANAARLGHQAAVEAREYLSALFELSNRQGDALSREDFDALDQLITEKAGLLEKLDDAVKSLKKLGWDLNNPSTYPKDSATATALRGAADISRRLQAHERYILGQMIVQRQLVGDRMDTLLQKRLAVAGYRTTRKRGKIIDAAS